MTHHKAFTPAACIVNAWRSRQNWSWCYRKNPIKAVLITSRLIEVQQIFRKVRVSLEVLMHRFAFFARSRSFSAISSVPYSLQMSLKWPSNVSGLRFARYLYSALSLASSGTSSGLSVLTVTCCNKFCENVEHQNASNW